MTRRRAGILLHVTSLPGEHGIGELGPVAVSFLDWMRSAELEVWQVLPLGPTGMDNSPYLSASAFAGNVLCLSPEGLRDLGLLAPELSAPVSLSGGAVDFAAVRAHKAELIDRAFAGFAAAPSEELSEDLARFRRREAFWLEDWSLFAALKAAHQGAIWTDWPGALRRHEAEALAEARRDLHTAVEREVFAQWLFDRQWRDLRTRAHARGIRLFGDLPIYVAHDSADVWARPELFLLDAGGRPHVVAGVPPDAFSEDGQLWGNPLYDWRRHERDGFAWWIARVRANLDRFDLLRIDHFRGLAGYWEVAADAATAREGRWRKGPGSKLLRALDRALDPEGRGLPLCAEDLGVITPDVEELRDQFSLPGMKVLQFGLGGPDLPGNERTHAVHHHSRRQVVYTGTHDNDTSEGWFESLRPDEQAWVLEAVGRGAEWLSWKLVRMAFSSVAELAIVPMQDLLQLGHGARMNTPGVAEGNWSWRFLPEQLPDDLAPKVARLAELTGRSRPRSGRT